MLAGVVAERHGGQEMRIRGIIHGKMQFATQCHSRFGGSVLGPLAHPSYRCLSTVTPTRQRRRETSAGSSQCSHTSRTLGREGSLSQRWRGNHLLTSRPGLLCLVSAGVWMGIALATCDARPRPRDSAQTSSYKPPTRLWATKRITSPLWIHTAVRPSATLLPLQLFGQLFLGRS